MCGIAGLLSLGDKPVFEEEIQSMCDAMVHRGPDDAGYYVRDGIALGMRRLSIIDLSNFACLADFPWKVTTPHG